MEQRTDSDERWVVIPGTEGCYEVSHRGRVWSRPRLGTRGGIMAGSTTPDGYRQVQLHCYGKMSNFRIHQLVALAFLGPTPDGMEICHKDGDQLNNDVSNLKFDTHRKNTQERVEHGHHWQAQKTHCDSGHEFTPENTYIRPDGCRSCRECGRAKDRRRRARVKGLTPAIPGGALF
jgi:hypothetical protein